MPGNTATISVAAFRADWLTHMPIAALCQRWTITKDQVIRLRDVWRLPLRNDRSLRYKPKVRQRDPTPREIEQSKKEIQAKWDAHTREERCVYKPQPVMLKRIEMTDEAWQALEGISDGDS